MKKELIIIGAGGLGREVSWMATETSQPHHVLGFLDDRKNIPDSERGGLPLLGSIDDWPRFSTASFVLAIGNPRTRAKIADRMLRNSNRPDFATLIHRNVHMAPDCQVASGSIVCAGCILTTNIVVGSHTIINIGTTIGHDVRIGSFVTLNPQVAVSGCVTLNDGVEVGTTASIRQGLSMAKGSMLGMGSVLTKNVFDSTFFFGVPAKPIKQLPPF